jgi:hypothetical protein
MTPRISVLAKIVEVDGVGQGSENSTARWRAVVVRTLSYTSLREATKREREVQVAGGRVEEEGGSQVEEDSWNLCVLLLLPWAPFI